MPSNFFASVKQFFSGYSVQTRKDCRYCGGGRCMGMCGGGLAKLTQTTVQGVLHINDEEEGIIENDGQILLKFDPKTYFGRMILKKCPPGEHCQIEALVQDVKMEKLISVKKLG